MLGQIYDFEKDTFDVTLAPEDGDGPKFMKASFNDAKREWILDIDYDAGRDMELKNGQTYVFELSV